MLIAVEGPDGVGKSTFVQLLSSLIPGAELRHCGPPEEDDYMVEYGMPLLGYIPGAGTDIIYDRLHVGEQVYGPIYRGHGMPQTDYYRLTKFMRIKGLFMVFLMPAETMAQANIDERGDVMVETSVIPQIYARYRHQITLYRLPCLVLDRYPTEEDAMQTIKLARRFEEVMQP
jgi:energy-coupling factor transporter ATP-binding protein EcfA2